MDGMDQYMRDMYGDPEVPAETHIDNRWYNIAREYFPGATDDEIGYILWNCTMYPFYPKGSPEEYIHKKMKTIVAGECGELTLIKTDGTGG